MEIRDLTVIHQWMHVLRLKEGDPVFLVDGDRRLLYETVIQSIRKSSMTLSLQKKILEKSGLSLKILVAAGLIKEQRWDYLLQKATELGASQIIPLETRYTVVNIHQPEHKKERWQAVVKSAAEQSEGLFLPEVSCPMTIENFLDELNSQEVGQTQRILLVEREYPHASRKPLKEVLLEISIETQIVLTVGPEGGWSSEEMKVFLRHGFQPVFLGARILRSETAAIAALGALICAFDK